MMQPPILRLPRSTYGLISGAWFTVAFTLCLIFINDIPPVRGIVTGVISGLLFGAAIYVTQPWQARQAAERQQRKKSRRH